MTRREFAAKVKLAGWDRCGGFCENCTTRLYPGKFRYDHILPDNLGGPPTIDNLQVICIACDTVKTAEHDVPRIAKTKRLKRRAAGIRKPRSIRAWRRFGGAIVYADRQR